MTIFHKDVLFFAYLVTIAARAHSMEMQAVLQFGIFNHLRHSAHSHPKFRCCKSLLLLLSGGRYSISEVKRVLWNAVKHWSCNNWCIYERGPSKQLRSVHAPHSSSAATTHFHIRIQVTSLTVWAYHMHLNCSGSITSLRPSRCTFSLLYDLVMAGFGQSLRRSLSYGPQTAPV